MKLHRSTCCSLSVRALIAATIMGAEIQHYQDPEEVDLRRVLDTLVVQLGDWLMPRTHGVASAGGIRA